MAVEKIGFTGTEYDERYLDISPEEISDIHDKLVHSFNTKLRRFGVKPPWTEKSLAALDEIPRKDWCWYLNARELQLIFLYKYRRKLVHKDLVSAFVRKYLPKAALDQQVRHLGTQYFWNVLNKGASIPDEDETVPSAYNYLVSIDQPNPMLLLEEIKRRGRIAAMDFSELKIIYGNKCATCGIQEGSLDARMNDTKVVLHKGHMDPSKPLELYNVIPQCEYCNRTYGNDFIFDEYGRVTAIYNPSVILRSPKSVRDEVYAILQEEKRKEGR